MSQPINLLKSRFVAYTELRLVKRMEIYTSIINDQEALDDEIAEAAKCRKEVRELLEIFKTMQSMGLDTDGMTAYDIIDTVLQANGDKNADYYAKVTPGGMLAQDIMDKSLGVTKTAVDGTKKALNGFASWLSDKTK